MVRSPAPERPRSWVDRVLLEGPRGILAAPLSAGPHTSVKTRGIAFAVTAGMTTTRPTMARLLVIAAAVSSFAACATMRVSSHVERGIDVTR